MSNKLNPKVIKYIFTAVLSVIASILIILVTSFFSKKILSFYRSNSMGTTKLVADGYATLANEKLNSYFAALDSLYDEKIFSKGSSLDIIYSINKNKNNGILYPESIFITKLFKKRIIIIKISKIINLICPFFIKICSLSIKYIYYSAEE